MKRILNFCAVGAVATLLIGCSAAANYDAPPGFESASLNTTYAGPYQRPVVQAGRVPLDAIPSLAQDSQRPGDVGQQGDSASSRASARSSSRGDTRTSSGGETRRSRQSRGSDSRSRDHALLIESADANEAPPTSLPDFDRQTSSRAAATPTAPRRSSSVPGSGDPSLDYVRTVYALNGIEFQTASSFRVVDMYRAVQQQGTIYHASRPVVGDMVFFHNTEDLNRDGRNNDWYTHVGIVESVADDGTVSFLHFHDGAVTRDRLNLETMTASTSADASTNSVLRHRKSGDPRYTQYLTGDLFAGFGSVLGDRSEFYVIDQWEPGQRADHRASLGSQSAQR